MLTGTFYSSRDLPAPQRSLHNDRWFLNFSLCGTVNGEFHPIIVLINNNLTRAYRYIVIRIR